jgi:hypothetical protein
MVWWSAVENSLLQKLICTGTINPSNSEPGYLFQITQDHFPAFLGVGATGWAYAIQHLCCKFCLIQEESHLWGARRAEGLSFILQISFYNSSICF